jgi:RNA polymerase sigma-70 factor (sigma-E family)
VTDDMGFGDFVAASAGPLKQAAFLLTGDRQLAEDLVQATLLRLFERWGRSAVWDSPLAYARTTMYSIFVSWGRRRRVKEVVRAAVPDQQVAGHEDMYDTTAAVLAALHDLPPRQRAAVVLHYYDGLDAAEIATVLDCSPVTVRSQLSRALAKLRIDARLSRHPSSERP